MLAAAPRHTRHHPTYLTFWFLASSKESRKFLLLLGPPCLHIRSRDLAFVTSSMSYLSRGFLFLYPWYSWAIPVMVDSISSWSSLSFWDSCLVSILDLSLNLCLFDVFLRP